MENFLRQLLDMVSSVPAPGREPAMPQTVPANSPGASVQGLREVQPGPQDFVPNETRGQYSDRQRAGGNFPDSGTQPLQEDEIGNAIPMALTQGVAAGARDFAKTGVQAAKATTRQRDIAQLIQTLQKHGAASQSQQDLNWILRQAVGKAFPEVAPAVESAASEATGVGKAAAGKMLKMADQEYDLQALSEMMKMIAKKEGK